MRSDAWTERRSESAKAEDERKAEIELAQERVIEAAHLVRSARGLAISIGEGEGYRSAIDNLCDAVAKLEELTR